MGKMIITHEKSWDLVVPQALWAYRIAEKEGTKFSPYHLVYGKEALLPLDVEIPALQLLMKLDENPDLTYPNRLLDMQEAQSDRMKAVEHYTQAQEKNQWKVNKKFKDKEMNKGDLVMRYDSRLDFTFKTRFMTKWEGPYLVVQKLANGSYQLADLDGSLHKNRGNGLRFKKYVVRVRWAHE